MCLCVEREKERESLVRNGIRYVFMRERERERIYMNKINFWVHNVKVRNS